MQQIIKSQINDIDIIMKPQQEETVTTFRQVIQITDDKQIALDYWETRMKELLADATSMIGEREN